MKNRLQLKLNERGSISIMALVFIFILILLTFVVVDYYYITQIKEHIKGQQDLAHLAVYTDIDETRLADREVYIDDIKGRNTFEKYLVKNLELDSQNRPGKLFMIDGDVKIIDFIIYNEDDLPAITPKGKRVELFSIYSEIEFTMESFMSGRFGKQTYRVSLTTDIPDKLLKYFHP